MNYIIDFSNDPNSLNPEQFTQLNSALTDAVKNKISNIENKYNVKLKFPKNICNSTKNNDKRMPLPMIPSLITSGLITSDLMIPSLITSGLMTPDLMTSGLMTSGLTTPMDINIFVPFNVIIENTSNENTIDGLSSCMRIVNSIKKDLELYSTGKKTKEQFDSSFIEWNDESDIKRNIKGKETPIYESEIDEAYEKKFGNKALIKKLIQELELI